MPKVSGRMPHIVWQDIDEDTIMVRIGKQSLQRPELAELVEQALRFASRGRPEQAIAWATGNSMTACSVTGSTTPSRMSHLAGTPRAGSGSCGSSKAAFRNRRFPGLPELPRVPARRFAKSAAAVWIAFINVLA
jgi:hypothetical protein